VNCELGKAVNQTALISVRTSELEATNRKLVSRKIIGPSKSVSDAHLAARISSGFDRA
jgi:hypothetical protein